MRNYSWPELRAIYDLLSRHFDQQHQVYALAWTDARIARNTDAETDFVTMVRSAAYPPKEALPVPADIDMAAVSKALQLIEDNLSVVVRDAREASAALEELRHLLGGG